MSSASMPLAECGLDKPRAEYVYGQDALCLPAGLPDPTPHRLFNTSNPHAAALTSVSSCTACENVEITVGRAALDDSDSAQS